MLTRSKLSVIDTLYKLKSNILPMNTYINLVSLYYKSERMINNNYIIKLCLNDEQYNKIKNKRIIIYNNNDYEYAELIGNERVAYDQTLVNKYNKHQELLLKSIDDNLLDDVTIDMLIDDNDNEIANILYNMKDIHN
jgi:hypothetical protein|uniref:Uncharacterized protein n=1 Tax=viral metagenome TaxID=1070528 RepID=A0A6C0I707_9ZZZZ